MCMKRKVILHGPSTLTVSLPSKWVKANNVKKGDLLNVLEKGDSLEFVIEENKYDFKEKHINITGLSEDSIWSLLCIVHKSGFDQIKIDYSDVSSIESIQKIIDSMLIGYEIVDQNKNSLVVKSISTDNIEEINNLLRRLFLVLISLSENSLKFVNKKIDDINEVLTLEKSVNRLSNYCERLVNKKTYKNSNSVYLYMLAWLLESIGDSYRDISKSFLNNAQSIKRELIDFYESTNKLLLELYDYYYKKKDSDIYKTRTKAKKNVSYLNSIDNKKLNNVSFKIFSYLKDINLRIIDCTSPLVSLNL
jgi:phosphate uptake regulator